MQRGALVSGFVNISVYFYKLLFDRLLKKFNILLVIRAEYWSDTSSFSHSLLLMLSAIHCSTGGDDSRKICGSSF